MTRQNHVKLAQQPVPLATVFENALFRVPDYQRGYAWQKDQLRAFWEDLLNLSRNQKHYTGVLTLTEIDKQSVPNDSNEFWLVDRDSYKLFNVVDGQQRLTTVVVFIQALSEFIQSLPENKNKRPSEIRVTDDLNLLEVQEKYLFRVNSSGGYRTYVFGYSKENPSDEYFRAHILSEDSGKQTQETFYTVNLENAKKYFSEQIKTWHEEKGKNGLKYLFCWLTTGLVFNEHVISDEFDVFVAFETMNNRGKKLSDLELLKNRLIYLTTLYDENQLDKGGKKALRDKVNEIWKEIYYQLGRNKNKPLNDDDFLRAHWISYFQYSRDTGRDYAKFLLDEHFSPRNVHALIERDVSLEVVEEQRTESETETAEDIDDPVIATGDSKSTKSSRLTSKEIYDYVVSLGNSAKYWFNSFYPHLATGLSDKERAALDRLNRIGIGYFRPLVMVILKSVDSEDVRIEMFSKIERFIFIAFRIGTSRSNLGSSRFYKLARELNQNQVTVDQIKNTLNDILANFFREDDTLNIDKFKSILEDKFKSGSGYYGWSGLRYFLYEYEQKLLAESRQPKIQWEKLLKSENDKISIEHIYPQTPTEAWSSVFKNVNDEDRKRYSGALGNLLVLSMSINASLQNDAFEEKKDPKFAQDKKIRNGYSDGSHSEIEVSRNEQWGPKEIRARSLDLMKFMEERWGFHLSESDRIELLFLPKESNDDISDR